jgi:hypothetical protein
MTSVTNVYNKAQNVGLLAFGAAGAVVGFNLGLRVGFWLLGTPKDRTSTK